MHAMDALSIVIAPIISSTIANF